MTTGSKSKDAPTKEPSSPAGEQNEPIAPGSDPECFLEADPETQTAMVLKDFKAAYRLLESGDLDAYGGLFAAFLHEQLVGTGPDSMDLRLKVSKEQHVHPERIAVIHVWNEAVL
jgi:hypothetical protein